MKHMPITIRTLLSVLLVLSIGLSAFWLLAPPRAAHAAATDWRNPAGDLPESGGDNNGFELLPQEAYTDGGDYARNEDGFNDRHQYYNYGLETEIPAGAVITGIEIRIDGWSDRTNNIPRYDVVLSWDGGNSWTTAQSISALTTSEESYILGGSEFTWGRTWAREELTDDNFSVRIISRATGTGRGQRDFYLDWIGVRVYYATATINGTIWEDVDSNGVQNAGEPGLGGVDVVVYRDDGDSVFEGGSDDVLLDVSPTNGSGVYGTGPFLEGFNYWIEVFQPPGYTLTTPPEPRLVAVPDGNPIAIDFGYEPNVFNPSIEISKLPDTQQVVSGSVANFTITVTNTGDVTLTPVVVTDALTPNCDRTFASLSPGASQTYQCGRAGVTSDFTNSATVVGTAPANGTVTDTDTAFVDVIHPALDISKTPDMQTVIAGSVVTFTIAATNTGDVPLAPVNVSDPLVPDCNRSFASLTPGAKQVYTCALSNPTLDFTNIVTAVGILPIGGAVSDSDPAQVRVPPVCAINVVAHWKFNEVVGPVYVDSSDSHNGQCDGECPTATAGQIDGAQTFNGLTTGVSVPSHADFNWGQTDSFSIEFWMKTDAGSTCAGNQVVIGRDDPATNLHWWTGCKSGGQVAFYLADRNGTLAGAIGTKDVTDGQWHHVVAVRDGGSNHIRLYVDGAQEASTSAIYQSGFDSATAPLNISWLNLSSLFRFSGIVDEIVLFKSALSTDEVREHYIEGSVGQWFCGSVTYAPTIVSTANTQATVGQPYTYNVDAAGNPDPVYALTASPSGMAINPGTGMITWTPTAGQEGEHSVTVQASNSAGADQQTFVIEATGAGSGGPQSKVFIPLVLRNMRIFNFVAYWRLDETSGPPYADAAGEHDAACAGQCPAPTTGRLQGGQAFNGNNTRLDAPGTADVNWGARDSFSIEFWMKTDSASVCSTNQVAIGRNDAATNVHWWVGCFKTGNRAAFYLRDTGGSLFGVQGATDLTDGRWHYVVAVRDGAANQLRIYVDGLLEGSTAASYSSSFDSSVPLNIGWVNLSHGYHFNGVIDEVAIHNEALSAFDVLVRYGSFP